MRIELSAVVWA